MEVASARNMGVTNFKSAKTGKAMNFKAAAGGGEEGVVQTFFTKADSAIASNNAIDA